MSDLTHIDRAASGDPSVRAILSRHPRVHCVEVGDSDGVQFEIGPWKREVLVGDASQELYGLLEAIDNNPLVCADTISVHGKAATLAMIALGPLIQAGLIADSPVMITTFEPNEAEVSAALRKAGWYQGVSLHTEPFDLDGVLAATVMVSIHTPEDLGEVGLLYDEQFGRSFYVRRDESSAWDPELVKNRPFAVYRLQFSPDSPQSLLTVRLLCDTNGKAGASQVVHAMNVMCGFEESLGIS